MMFPFSTRISQLQHSLSDYAAVLLTRPSDIFYFTGIMTMSPNEIESLLLVTPSSCTVYHTPLSSFQKIQDVLYIASNGTKAIQKIVDEQKSKKISQLYIDTQHIPTSLYLQLIDATLYPEPLDRSIVWNLRAIKDSVELDTIRTACSKTTTILTTVQKSISAGMTEHEVSQQLKRKLIEAGCQETAFTPIVAFGAHTASPHHISTAAKLKINTPVLIDFGCKYNNYCSDMTRSFWFGDSPSDQFLQIKTAVDTAYRTALQELQLPSPTAQQVDTSARTVIKHAGYEEQFIHTTGHGLGLDIHEPPSLNGTNNQSLKSDMVLTIEPGIYLTGACGYRYENTVLVGSKPEELT